VKYEPLKALTVGGVDIHLEINALIIAWQLNKGPEEFGRALVAFLRDFRELDDSTEQDTLDSSSTNVPEKDVALSKPIHEHRTTKFWTEVLQKAMIRLGGGHDLMSEECLSADIAHRYGDAIEAAIAHMLEKTRLSMKAGIQGLATATVDFVDGLKFPCSDVLGAKKLRSAASRLRVVASAKTLINFAKHVEYEPMQVLKVGGIDVHKELNRFLVAWIQEKGASELAEGLVDFFEDFNEHEVEEKANVPAAAPAPEPEVLAILRDAIQASSKSAGKDAREHVLSEACVTEAVAGAFVDGVERAFYHMLQKKKLAMQSGLKDLADVTNDVFQKMSELGTECRLSHDAEIIWHGAQQLLRLSRRTVVEYGANVKYEAMKSLVVGTVDIHRELNDFIGTWKLRSRREAGESYGVLMRKLVAIRGKDEL
jgi:hypothetical protein